MDIPLLDNIDIEILQHRDVHFGGNFAIMIDYYQNEGVGVNENFEFERIEELQAIQESIGENLSASCLPMPEIEKIEEAKRRYFQLRDLYEDSADDKSSIPKLISDLILSEDEEPEAEIDAIVAQGEAALPALLIIIESLDFYDPLFPGYGRAPILVANCLQRLKSPKAIAPLFNAIGKATDDFFFEEEATSAILATADEAKTFLLKQLVKLPFSYDNEKAAYMLTRFASDPDIRSAALALLDQDLSKGKTFKSYLTLLISEEANAL